MSTSKENKQRNYSRYDQMSAAELEKLVKKLEKQMKKAAAELNFEAAAELRDKLIELKKHLNETE